MAEGLDLTSKVVGHDIPVDDNTILCVITKLASQKEPSTSSGKKPEVDEEKERYLQERKRKGKAPVKKKQNNKKQRTDNTGVASRGNHHIGERRATASTIRAMSRTRKAMCRSRKRNSFFFLN